MQADTWLCVTWLDRSVGHPSIGVEALEGIGVVALWWCAAGCEEQATVCREVVEVAEKCGRGVQPSLVDAHWMRVVTGGGG